MTETPQISRHTNFANKITEKVGELSDLMVDKWIQFSQKCEFPDFDEEEEDDARFDRENPCKAADQSMVINLLTINIKSLKTRNFPKNLYR